MEILLVEKKNLIWLGTIKYSFLSQFFTKTRIRKDISYLKHYQLQKKISTIEIKAL